LQRNSARCRSAWSGTPTTVCWTIEGVLPKPTTGKCARRTDPDVLIGVCQTRKSWERNDHDRLSSRNAITIGPIDSDADGTLGAAVVTHAKLVGCRVTRGAGREVRTKRKRTVVDTSLAWCGIAQRAVEWAEDADRGRYSAFCDIFKNRRSKLERVTTECWSIGRDQISSSSEEKAYCTEED